MIIVRQQRKQKQQQQQQQKRNEDTYSHSVRLTHQGNDFTRKLPRKARLQSSQHAVPSWADPWPR